MKNSAKVMIWGAMGAHGLSNVHIVPAGKTITSDNYIRNILVKKLKPAIERLRDVGDIDNVRLVLDPKKAVFVQDGAPPHTAARTQIWLSENVPNFIPSHEWPGNSPDLNPIENLWSILDNDIYKEPVPKKNEQFTTSP